MGTLAQKSERRRISPCTELLALCGLRTHGRMPCQFLKKNKNGSELVNGQALVLVAWTP